MHKEGKMAADKSVPLCTVKGLIESIETHMPGDMRLDQCLLHYRVTFAFSWSPDVQLSVLIARLYCYITGFNQDQKGCFWKVLL